MIALNRRLLLALAFCAGTIAAATAGSTGEPAGIGSLEAASDREIGRRQEDLIVAEQLIRSGDQARSEKDIAKAYGLYKQAADMVPQGSAASGLRSRVISRFSSASVEYAQYLVGRGEYAEARSVATEVLDPRYNPDYKPAIAFLSHLEEADYFNKTVTPEFAAKRDDVQKLLQEAAGFYDSGRYDLATRRYRQTLGIDAENAAALRGLEQVELAKQRYYETAYNETRSRMLWQVEKAWARPVPSAEAMQAGQGFELAQDQRAGTVQMMNRLGEMILDRVGPFTDASIQDVVAWFRRKSAELSPDGEEPINITLQLPSGAPSAPVVDETGQTTVPSSTPGLVTLELTDVPFYDALRYAATIANMKVRVDPYAVSVIPMSESSESLIMRTFKVPPDFLISGSAQEESAPEAYAGSGPDESYDARLKLRGGRPMQAEAFLRKKGVEFPDGATATLAPGGTELIVRNTPSALEFIEAIVEAATLDRPTQVEIDAKFVEISQSNLKELGFDWTLGPFSIGGSGVFGTGGNTPNSTRVLPFTYPGSSTPVGVDTATGGLRTGTGSLPYSAVTINSLNAVLAGQQLGSAGGPAPGIFSIAGIFTNPQFQVLIRALNQKKGVDLMAAPKVTAKSGQRAKINISREFPYPQEFEPPQIPQNTGGSIVSTGTGAGLLNSTDTSDPIVTPSFPTDFTTRDLGVVLEVEPQVGADGREIELSLSPEVADFEGFINYGSPIYAAPAVNSFTGALDVATAGIISPQRQLLTENIINQPIFSTRKVTTNVSIWDGQTVALGGLIREDIQKVSDKVPILGDIPMAGVLFRSEVEQKIKRNLIIFVTARLIDAYGQPLRPEEDTEGEEMVEPLGLPPETPLPQRANPKGGLTRK